ncbi:MAG: hypothetical protein AAGI38_17275 [Bacteroidota bacterium]
MSQQNPAHFSAAKFEASAVACLGGICLAALLYTTPREAFSSLMLWWGGAFVVFTWWLIRLNHLSIPWIIGIGIAWRLIAVFSLPELSDDYFRFLWDGHLLANGVSPFEALPTSYTANPRLMASLGLTPELFEGLNSPEYFTIYPPVCQAVFWVAVTLFPESIAGGVYVMKGLVFLAEIGTLLIGAKLLEKADLPSKRISLYALNPLVIVELTGNLHLEAFMLFFLLASLFFLANDRWSFSILPFTLAVCSKLLPLMLLPLLVRYLGFWKSARFGVGVLSLTILLFRPILDLETLQHLASSVALYFQQFEFNASVYYLLKPLVRTFIGYKAGVVFLGRALGILAFLGILAIGWIKPRKDLAALIRGMFWTFALYLSLATTVHPWYVSSLVLLGMWTSHRFPIFWSLLLPMTYLTYLNAPEYQEVFSLVAVSYLLVYGMLALEVFSKITEINKMNFLYINSSKKHMKSIT